MTASDEPFLVPILFFNNDRKQSKPSHVHAGKRFNYLVLNMVYIALHH